MHRTQTALQGCKRVHMLAVARQRFAGKDDVWEDVAKIASIGMGPDYIGTAKAYCQFVQKWSGGVSGHLLENLEACERVLDMKRKISPNDLRNMAKIDLLEATMQQHAYQCSNTQPFTSSYILSCRVAHTYISYVFS